MKGLNHTDYEKILELFKAGQYVLAQQLVRKDVNRFADWLANYLINYFDECNDSKSIVFSADGYFTKSYITMSPRWDKCIQANYIRNIYDYNNFNTKIGRIKKLLKLKQYGKVKQKLKGILKTLLLKAIHNKLN